MNAIEIIMLPVKDQKKAKQFYESLGFQVLVEAPMEHGQTWLQMGLPGGGATISLASFSGIICETDDIQSEVKELKDKGVEIKNIDDTPWGKFAWLKDPDGNSLCLHQPK